MRHKGFQQCIEARPPFFPVMNTFNVTKTPSDMRTISFLPMVLVMTLLFMGCSKSSEEAQPAAGRASFQEQMLDILPILDERHVLKVEYNSDPATGQPAPTFLFLPSTGESSGSRQIVCRGSGLSFANCCKDWLEAHPGKCLKVYSQNGTYFADDNC